MDLIFTLTACVGLTFILKYGTILSWPRTFLSKLDFFDKLFKCSLCLGFWSGAIIAGASYFIEWNPLFYLLPLVSSVGSWVVDSSLRCVQTIEMTLDKYIQEK